MKVVNYTKARNNLKSLFDSAYHDSEEIIIHRKNGEHVVMLSLDMYNAMNETEYLLSSVKNKEHLLNSIHSSRAVKLTK
jgi:antitoxin YefM